MAPDASSIEREVKFETGPAFSLPDLRGVVGETVALPELELRAAYFDSSDFRLWQQGITFRHRTGEGPEQGVWTMKLPADSRGVTLDRSELNWAGDRRSVPPEAARIVRGVLRHSPLDQIVELVTTRTRLALVDTDGVPLGEVDDDSVTVIGGQRDGLRFRQVEVELADAGETVIDAVVAEFRKAGVLPGQQPKLARALELPPRRSGAVSRLGGSSSLGEVVRASVADAFERTLDHDYRLRLGPGEVAPHDVHQARVATRRLRSDLKTLATALDPEWVGHTRTELRWLGEALGGVRDLDVLALQLPAGDPSGEALAGVLAEERGQAVGRLVEVLESDRYLVLLDRLDAAVERPPFIAGPTGGSGASRHLGPGDLASQVLPDMVGSAWTALRRKVRRSGSRPSDLQLHRIRIGSKQLRYAAELAEPVIGEPARRAAAAAEELQTVLGEHHDAVAAEEWCRRVGLGATSAVASAAGRMAEAQVRRQRQTRRQWRPVWEKLDTEELWSWLN